MGRGVKPFLFFCFWPKVVFALLSPGVPADATLGRIFIISPLGKEPKDISAALLVG